MSKKTKQRDCLPQQNVTDTCSPLREQQLETFEAIVNAYIANYRSRAEREMNFYLLQNSGGKLIEYAGMAKMTNGKRHPHQYRIKKLALAESKSRLDMIDFSICKNFDDVLSLVEEAIGEISGIGELTVYDTATRVAAGFGLEPDKIYLHAGTRCGAQALRLDRRQRYLEKNELPTAFRKLKAREIEDCLCIYKADLHRLAKSAP